MKTKILLFLYQYLPVIFYFCGLILVSIAAFLNGIVAGFVTLGLMTLVTAGLLAAGKGE